MPEIDTPPIVLVVEDDMVLRMRAVDVVEDAGFTPIEAGLGMLPVTLPLLVAAPLAGRFYERAGPRGLVTAGTLTAAIGFAVTAALLGEQDYWVLVPGYVLIGPIRSGPELASVPFVGADLVDDDRRQRRVQLAVVPRRLLEVVDQRPQGVELGPLPSVERRRRTGLRDEVEHRPAQAEDHQQTYQSRRRQHVASPHLSR